jgi:hypothetical protein
METLEADEEAEAGAHRLWQRLAGARRTQALSISRESRRSRESHRAHRSNLALFSSLGSVRHVFTHRDVTAEILLVRLGRAGGVKSRPLKEAWPEGEGRWCTPENGEPWGGGVSSFARKTLGLVPSARKTRQLSLVKQ